MSVRTVTATGPVFAENDRVYELVSRFGADNKRIIGTVIKVYLMDGRYRYVVRYDDNKEGIFFSFELLPNLNSSRGTGSPESWARCA